MVKIIYPGKTVELSELTTLKYEYSKAMINRDDKKILLIDIRFVDMIKLVKYTEYLKAGSDLSNVEVAHNEVAKQVTFKVPKAKVLDNVVELDNIEIENVKGNIFSDLPTQKIVEDVNTEKKESRFPLLNAIQDIQQYCIRKSIKSTVERILLDLYGD